MLLDKDCGAGDVVNAAVSALYVVHLIDHIPRQIEFQVILLVARQQFNFTVLL